MSREFPKATDAERTNSELAMLDIILVTVSRAVYAAVERKGINVELNKTEGRD
jgi:hypothetical protein